MSIPRKGSRHVRFDGEEYIWRIKKYPSHNERHNMEYLTPIQHVDGGQILLVSVGYCHSGYVDCSIFPVTPSLIERCIKYAISDGWKFRDKLPPLKKDCAKILKEEAIYLIMDFIESIRQYEENNSICQQIVNSTKSLTDAGEYIIALENTVENIIEAEIKLHKNVIDMAIRAFLIYGNQKYTQISKSMIKKENA